MPGHQPSCQLQSGEEVKKTGERSEGREGGSGGRTGCSEPPANRRQHNPSAHDHNNQDRAQKGGRTVGGLVERQTGKVVVASAVRGGVEEVLRELVAGLLRRRADKDRHVGPRHVVEL